ncbi:hypothetical protein EYF80_047171 [Liparis tanakae]|uniref:Uncharacterized protein n=1 Tax=Liparis tanakae TaxID=230148 RepID=A0A4Z2FP20_9TELE|nr:hypothetical protein EYF80_047171 [Liparis tanakae]
MARQRPQGARTRCVLTDPTSRPQTEPIPRLARKGAPSKVHHQPGVIDSQTQHGARGELSRRRDAWMNGSQGCRRFQSCRQNRMGLRSNQTIANNLHGEITATRRLRLGGLFRLQGGNDLSGRHRWRKNRLITPADRL